MKRSLIAFAAVTALFVPAGKTIVWTGTFYLINGSTTPIRDTYTTLGTGKQYDLSEAKVGGSWKVVAKTTCTKS